TCRGFRLIGGVQEFLSLGAERSHQPFHLDRSKIRTVIPSEERTGRQPGRCFAGLNPLVGRRLQRFTAFEKASIFLYPDTHLRPTPEQFFMYEIELIFAADCD